EGILLHWTSLAYQDHLSALAFGEERKKGGGTNFLMVLKPQFRGSLTNRGQMRGVFDGRYKFARFFAPTQHNLPQTWDDLIAFNDLELYDTQTDPGELNNLATNTEIHRDLLLTMNDKLNTLITKEIGDDDGHHMPGPSFIWRA
ncbi:MAG: sulfatase, partial [Parvibaculaceae bacterium]|nr:sulfatase [Parvibaculaceae bacterium]